MREGPVVQVPHRQGEEFQFSIGDATLTALTGRAGHRKYVSILYWRCRKSSCAPCWRGAYVSILYWRCVTPQLEAAKTVIKIRVSILYWRCDGPGRRLLSLLVFVSILYWRCA